jgi:hypothetical protein
METTLNMRIDTLEAITRAAESRGLSRSQMIVFLIKRVMADVPDALPMGSMVRYQNRRRPEDWRVIHIKVSAYEYEYMLDLRKLLKLSVSLICALAVQKYLKRPLEKCFPDNYPFFMNYMLGKEIINNIISWRIVWGFTTNITKYRKDQ